MDLIKKTITDNIENINTKLQDNVLKNQETLKLLIKLKNINSIINLSEN